MRLRNTLVLLLILAGLGAYVYFVERPREQREEEKKKLLAFEPDEVTEIRLSASDRTIVLAKEDGSWKLREPIAAPADEFAVKGLLRAVADAEVKRSLEDAGEKLADYGLEPPEIELRLRTGEKELPVLKVGKKTPVGYSVYLQKGDDPAVLLSSGSLEGALDKKVEDLRDRTVVRFEEDKVRRVALSKPDGEIVLVRADGKWRMERPEPRDADADVVRSFLTSLRTMRAVEFVSDDPKDLGEYGLDSPRLAVHLLAEGDREDRVLFGRENDKRQVYVKREGAPTVLAVSQWVYRDLDKKPIDFRDKTVLAFSEDEARRIRVERSDGGSFELVRKDGDWALENPGGKTIGYRIEQFVRDVRDLEGYDVAGENVTDLSAFGLEKPKLRITVLGKEKEVGTILVGKRSRDDKTEYTASAAGSGVVYLIRDYVFDRLDKKPEDFVEAPEEPGEKAAGGAEDEAAQS
ncbi:MAG: hypothetical protein KatS3mg076_1771 [Candidatus Binatia bacterium]|nr:MAG: hypothetical protein KatS3mg076_1771 [Candidatus Binatia bacterium]